MKEENMIKFSVIVPIYNCINDLPACVSSVLQQSEPDLELLLVDDGSTDGSGALCDRLAEQDKRIRVFHKTNGGASSARNMGLKHAVGEFIQFIDGDDTVEPDLLERVSATVSIFSPQMVIFGMSFDSYSAARRLEKTKHMSVKHSGLFSLEEILSDFPGFFSDNALASACNKAFSGDILRDTGLLFSEELTIYEDLDFVLRYLPHCAQIACLDCVLYHYHLPPQTTFTNPRVLHLETLLQNLNLIVRAALALNTQETTQGAADLCAQLFDQHLMTASYSRKQCPQVVAAIRDSTALQSLSEVGAVPSKNASASWPMVSCGAVSELYTSLQKRKLLCRMKQIVKPVLTSVGLYHG